MDKVETLNNKGIFMDNRTLLEKLSSRTWHALIPICLICLSFYLSYQEQIFPTISTPITVNQQQAISMALSANQVLKLKLNPKSVKATSAFVSRHDMQNYISLRGGGNKKLNELIKQGTFINSFWSVRLYIPKEIQENHFYFTSDGEFYGYQIDIPEDTLLPNMSQSSAEKKVRRFIHKHPLAHTNFDQYTLKDYTSSTQDNGRIDHTFIFSSPKNAIQEAIPEITCTLSGNRITKISTSYKMPENFLKDFESMYSYNTLLGSIGQAIIMIGYFGTAIAAIAYGWKKGLLNWKGATRLALFITTMSTLAQINIIPLRWYMLYNPSRSEGQFLSELITPLLSGALVQFIYLSITFLAAEYLTRQAFPKHPQLFTWLEPEQAGSSTSLKQVGMGYAMMFIDLGYIALFYLTALQIPGVWSPSFNLTDPNFLASYIPFFSPFANSLQAGIWEEFLFRALPIALAAIAGRAFKRPKLFIGVALVLQAIIFGLAHANYPQQPSYIRIIELSIPFFFWGLAYIYFGLLPCIISHYTYDMFVMSEAVMFIKTPGIWIQQTFTLLCLFLPIILILLQKIRYSQVFSWPDISLSARNMSWKADPITNTKDTAHTPIIQQATPPNSSKVLILCASAVIGLGSLIFYGQGIVYPSTKLTISKADALSIGQIEAEKFLDMQKPWTVSITAETNNSIMLPHYLESKIGAGKTEKLFQNRMLGTPEKPDYLGSFLPESTWHIRYALFEGSQDDRSESLDLYIRCKNMPAMFTYTLSENLPGTNISKEEAIQQAQASLQKYTLRNPQEPSWQVLDTRSETQPSGRVDWVVKLSPEKGTYHDLQPHWTSVIKGDKLSSISGRLFIPEKWIADFQEQLGLVGIIHQIINFGIVAGYIFLLYQTLQAYSQDQFTLYNIGKVFAIFFTLRLLGAFNNLPIIYQSLWTSSPIFNQLSSYCVSVVIFSFVISTTQSLYSNYILSQQKHTLNYTHAIYSWSNGLLLSFVFCIPIAATYFVTPTFYLQPNITQLSTYIPTLGTLLVTFLSITFTSSYILGLCLWMQRQRSTFAGASTLAMITCYNMSQLSFISIESYLLYTLLFMAVSIFAYFMIIREDLTSIIGIVAGQEILSVILQTSFNPYPDCWLHATLLTCLCLIISYTITYLIQTHQKDPEAVS